MRCTRIAVGTALMSLAVVTSCSASSEGTPTTEVRPEPARAPATSAMPTEPTVPPETPETTAALETARGFLEAENAHDADRALTYLSGDYIAAELGTPEEYRLKLSWEGAKGDKTVNIDCEQQGESGAGIIIRCTYDYHTLRSDEIGLGPYSGDYTDFTIRDGKIIAADSHDGFMTNGSSAQMWEPFATWVAAEHSGDILVMYGDASQTWPRLTEESIALWEQYTREYVDAQTPKGFVGLPPEGAPPSTPESGQVVASINAVWLRWRG